jgi:hypothetical protein
MVFVVVGLRGERKKGKKENGPANCLAAFVT